MIITECTNNECGHPFILGWESGDGYGFYRYVCEKCGSVCFVECTSVGGETLPEEDFFKEHPDAIAPK